MDSQKKVLLHFLNDIEAQPTQRTEEWHHIRKNTIGGSEIATVIGCNPYNSVQSLIAQKIGINNFQGNTACRWGTMFEHITEKYTCGVLKIERIYEAGSIPGIIERQRYSPDGLGIVQLLNCDNQPEWYIILFEFKAPMGTLPNKKIPKHYIPQIQMGMASIPIVDYSIFVNNCYRKCALKDIGFNNVYDKNFHIGDYKKLKNGLEKEIPYACGIICIYQTYEEYDKINKYYGYDSDEEYDINDAFNDLDDEYSNNDFESNYYTDHDMELLLDSKEALIDFGLADKYLIDRIFELYDQKRVSVVYYPIMFNKDRVNTLDFIKTHNLERTNENIKNPKKYAENCIKTFEEKCINNNLCPIGYLPWKLMRSDVILEEKDEKFVDNIKEPLMKTLELMQKINDSENPVDEFYNIYPLVEESEEYFEDINSMNDITNGLNNDDICI